MFKGIRLLVLAGIIGAVSACAQKDQDFLVVEPEPLSVEPVYTGKYK